MGDPELGRWGGGNQGEDIHMIIINFCLSVSPVCRASSSSRLFVLLVCVPSESPHNVCKKKNRKLTCGLQNGGR